MTELNKKTGDSEMTMENDIAAIIGPQGLMEQKIPGFTFRNEQLRMANAVKDALDNETFLLAEAGTGVGKTFAYLLPAFLFAAAHKEKVIIATKTKALQEQIVERDIPQLQKIIKTNLKVIEAKGRENYLCWNKYISAIAGKKPLSEAEASFVQAILTWAENTHSGDKKELALDSKLMKNWSILAADRHSCQKECPYHDKCFRLKMLRNLEKADIIVTNHALLLADALLESKLFPDYEYLIIDEAHAFARESFDKLAHRFTLRRVLETYYSLYYRQGFIQKGQLLLWRNKYGLFKPAIAEAITLVEKGAQLIEKFFNSLKNIKKRTTESNFNLIFDEADIESLAMEKTFAIYSEWQSNHQLLIAKLQELVKTLDDENPDEISTELSILWEEGDSAFIIMEESLNRADTIAWLEYENFQVSAVASAQVSINDIINDLLYEKLKTMVMVSATITTARSFDHFIERNGLQYIKEQERLNTIIEDSPFNYQEQACMYILQDMSDPNSQHFQNDTNQFLAKLIALISGRTLILFTSRQQLQYAAGFLRPICKARGLELIAQYEDGEFSSLINNFITKPNTVLMGVETFWEGVDLKGDILRLLVIVKLPFRSPGDPFTNAWDKYYKMQNKNSFSAFMLPDAVVRFKQGTGRLIRSEEDYGAVIIMDNRLLTKNYGRAFLQSIPFTNIMPIKRDAIAQNLSPWIYKKD